MPSKRLESVCLTLFLAFCCAPVSAQTPDTISACYQRAAGTLRRVGEPGDCRANEAPLSWNIFGPQGLQGPAGPQGLQGPPGLDGQQGPPGLQGPGGVRGMTAATTHGTYTFTVPAGVTAVLVEAWGAGGGGGWPPINNLQFAFNGGGGGGGAYVRAVIPVSPGDTYNIVVGEGGLGGVLALHDVTAGGDTTFGDATSGDLIISAGGGGAGGVTLAENYNVYYPVPGTGGTPGIYPDNAVHLAGHDGDIPEAGLAFGGLVGSGGVGSVQPYPQIFVHWGQPGHDGAVMIQW